MELSEPLNQSIDSFWGVELSGKNRVHSFEEDDEENLETVLELRQACLGADAKEGRNVVQVTTQNENDESVTHTLLSMRVGGTEMAPLFVTLRPPSKLELVKGTGPIHILGTTITNLGDYSDDDDDEEEEDEVPTNDILVKKGTKRSASSPVNQPWSKSLKVVEAEAEEDSDEEEDYEEEDSDEDEEDGEDEEEELERFQKPVVTKKGAKKATRVEEPDDDESMSEEDEDEESDDEEEEEEEETMEVAPPKSKKQSQSKPQFKTPQPQKTALKSSLKSPMSAPKPKKGSEKKPAGKPTGAMSLDEIKKKLATSPNLPRKFEKFNNYMSNNFKVSDASVKKQLWEFVQKSKK